MASKRDLTTEQSGFAVGDILCGTTHWYRTVTYWYRIVRTTPKRVFLRKLPVSYETEYMDNTPGSYCMPIIDGNVDFKCPYYTSLIEGTDETMGKIVQYRWGAEWDKPLVIPIGNSYGPISLSKWDGQPGWVNCD